ncbi:hypothetical protein CRH09_34320 [Nocardia terpenica]|uniref:Cystatin domain-containing protein n=2 Tax=Nocardia terpenica TaxID=455432 RepID=A0A291RTE4_9NOCA|nr:hypothetical protein CRH09_34320 [Nocardia terpenica]
MLIISSLLAVSALIIHVPAEARAEGPIGGCRDMDAVDRTNDPRLGEAAAFAAKQLDVRLLGIESACRQLVSGFKYRMTLWVLGADIPPVRRIEVEVYRKLDGTLILLR